MDEIYVMRVTDLRTGKLIQLADVRLCIDTIDTVSFADRNGDGFPDLRIERPVHCRDSVQDGKTWKMRIIFCGILIKAGFISA